jgi:hypothetical protein
MFLDKYNYKVNLKINLDLQVKAEAKEEVKNIILEYIHNHVEVEPENICLDYSEYDSKILNNNIKLYSQYENEYNQNEVSWFPNVNYLKE